MARDRTFLLQPNAVVHVWNEGVRREQLFHCDWDFLLFLRLLLQTQKLTDISVLLYALTPLRFDLVLHQHKTYAVSLFMKRVCNTYSRLVNQRLRRNGHSFLKRYSGQPVRDADEFLELSYMLQTNAVVPGGARTPTPPPFSSHDAYLGEPHEGLVDTSLLWQLVGGPKQYARFLATYNQADPGSAGDFLCPESPGIWARRHSKKSR